MKCRFFHGVGLAAAVAVAAGLAMTGVVEAQNYAAGAAAASTPRTPDGKPDLNGMWQDAADQHLVKTDENGNSSYRFLSRRCDPTEKGPDGIACYENTNQNADFEFIQRLNPNRPLYKPEYWDKVQDLDYNTNTKDPLFTCMPMGVPRMGLPRRLFRVPGM